MRVMMMVVMVGMCMMRWEMHVVVKFLAIVLAPNCCYIVFAFLSIIGLSPGLTDLLNFTFLTVKIAVSLEFRIVQ